MRRIILLLLVLSLSLSGALNQATAGEEPTIISSSGAREWIDGTVVRTDQLGRLLNVRDVPGGTFSLTSTGHNDFVFDIAPLSGADAFAIEIWRIYDWQIQLSQSVQISSGQTRFTVYDVQNGETIYWCNLDAGGNTYTGGYALKITCESASGTPNPGPLGAAKVNPYPDYYIGATVKMGVYPQWYTNGQYLSSEIEWIVLDIQGEYALLISKYGLDSRQFHGDKSKTTWERCYLRKWLNETFYENQFRKWEKEYIRTTTVTADENPDWDGDPGRNTQDKVFLLSLVEVYEYMPAVSQRQCRATAYAKHRGGYTNAQGCGWWWLRSPGKGNNGTMVHSSGNIYSDGDPVTSQKGLIRPCIWVKMH